MVNKLFALVTYHCFRQHRKKVVRQGLIMGMYVNLHVLSFKFATKVKMEERAAGKENAEAGKRRSKKGKMHPE